MSIITLNTRSLPDSAVTTAKIAADAITDAKIADDVVGTEHLTAGEVDATALGADSVTAAKINNDIISGSTELASEPADTDEFLVSDAGTIKRIDYSLIKGGGGFEFISNTALSNAGTLDINSVFSSTYQNYRIIGSGINGASDNTRLEMQLRTTSAVTNSAYYWTGVGQHANGNAVDDGDQNTTAWRIITNTANSGQSINFDMTVYRPQASLYTSFTSLCAGRRSGGNSHNLFSGGYQNTTNSYTGFRLFFETGNLSAGNVTVFGIKDS